MIVWLGAIPGACVLFTAYVAVFGIGPYDIPAQSRKLDEVIEESKRLGLPMTQADLKPEEPVPDDQNAALEVVRYAKEVGRQRSNSDLAYHAAGTPERVELEAAIAKVAPFLDAIVAELDTKPGWFIDRDYDLGPNVLFPEYADLKSVAKNLSARSSVRADANDVDGALTDLKACRVIRLKTLEDPTLIAALVSTAIDTIALRANEQLVTAWADDPVALTKLEDALAETDQRIDPRPALRGEFYMSLATIRNLKVFGGWASIADQMGGGGSPTIDPDELQRSGLPEGMFARAFMTTFALEWNEVFRSFEASDAAPRGWGQGIDKRAAKMEENVKLSEILASILMPVFSQADVSLSRDDVNQDLHKALVRVMRFRAENGRLPETLEEADAAFSDPFNKGQTIQSIITESEVRIWSIGPNGVDDLGRPKSSANRARDDTAVFWPAAKRAESSEN